MITNEGLMAMNVHIFHEKTRLQNIWNINYIWIIKECQTKKDREPEYTQTEISKTRLKHSNNTV